MKKIALVAVLFIVSGCGVTLSDQALVLFPQLEKNTAAEEQLYRANMKDKLKANLKDGADKDALVKYLEAHGAALTGIAATAKNLNAAVNAGK